jgi:hypothetical protein
MLKFIIKRFVNQKYFFIEKNMYVTYHFYFNKRFLIKLSLVKVIMNIHLI